MGKEPQILVINPGSTSTKLSVFRGREEIHSETLYHSAEELARFPRVTDQYPLRVRVIEESLARNGFEQDGFDAIVARGGLLHPLEGGTYRINEKMVQELLEARYGEHASNLGAIIAWNLSRKRGIPAFIVDPVVVDEMEEIARLSGLPELPRKSIFHALNQKAVDRKAAEKLGKKYNEVNVIVAHMGGGITVGLHRQGRVVDVNNGLDGEGPYTPERTGSLPVGDLIRLCFSGKYTREEMLRKNKGQGGVVAYLGTNDMREVERRALAGDPWWRLVYEGMAYQVAKEIGALSTVVAGKVDAIVLTGGVAHSELFVGWIRDRVSFLAPVFVFPGEMEMEALALGAYRVLIGEEQAKEYV
ncbi:MAG: butyrate kinase [candidate division KSB1 bacterium]|nr:butyrate kinase [candidate division KSB1 bacterium]